MNPDRVSTDCRPDGFAIGGPSAFQQVKTRAGQDSNLRPED